MGRRSQAGDLGFSQKWRTPLDSGTVEEMLGWEGERPMLIYSVRQKSWVISSSVPKSWGGSPSYAHSHFHSTHGAHRTDQKHGFSRKWRTAPDSGTDGDIIPLIYPTTYIKLCPFPLPTTNGFFWSLERRPSAVRRPTPSHFPLF